MDVFLLTLTQMAVMFLFMAAGFTLSKAKIVPQDSHTALARIVAFVLMPAMNIRNLMSHASIGALKENSFLLLCGLGVAVAAVLLSYPLSALLFLKKPKTEKEQYLKNIYKYSFTVANFGYIGNVLVREVWGETALFKYLIFTLPIFMLVYTWGSYILIPAHGEKGIKSILKRLCNPLLISVLAGILLGVLGVGKYVPQVIDTALEQASNCVGPVCMLLAGVTVGSCSLKAYFKDVKIYLLSLMRLIVIPTAFVLALKFAGLSDEVLQFALVAFATPIGLNVIVLPATYDSDVEPGAAMVLLTNALSVATIPLLYLLLIEIL